MIAKNIILYLLLIVLPDMFIWFRYFRGRKAIVQLLWFLPALLLLIATFWLASKPDFVPDNMTWLNAYLLAAGLIVLPKVFFSLCALPRAILSFFRKQQTKPEAGLTMGEKTGLLAIPVLWILLLWGSFIGPKDLEIKHVELTFDDLPEAFEGYRIVQFTDVHLASIDADLLKECVDSINAQDADAVVFTGDLQCKQPDELLPHMELLKTISARDGVFSVMGNHDYPEYVDADDEDKQMLELRMHWLQNMMGWKLLLNSHKYVYRGQDSIVIAGMENDGEGRFPALGNIPVALGGVGYDDFIVMLEHDPSSWRRRILPECHAQLTLSGHTHGMQFGIFGWSPLSLFKAHCMGLYEKGHRYLYVSKGVGGVVPFRIGCKPEIVVLTLMRKKA